MILATTPSGKFLGMFRDLVAAKLFATTQPRRLVQLNELPDDLPTSTPWRTKAMPVVFLFGTVLPVHNPYIIGLLLLGLAGAIVWAPRPLKVGIPTDCSDPNLPWWRWIAQGCYLLQSKVKLLHRVT